MSGSNLSDSQQSDMDRLRRIVVNQLESLARAGLSSLPKTLSQERWLIEAASSHTAAPPLAKAQVGPPPASRFDLKPTNPRPSIPAATPEPVMPRPIPAKSAVVVGDGSLLQTGSERIAALEAMRCQVAECTLCPALVKNRTQTVFGVGNPEPQIVFFGEAPGADEDRQGEPFVGRAGQLLTKIIEACGFSREVVYILNVLRCRPPDNRTPLDEEVENCRRWFEGQLRILRPQYIVCVGSVPTKALFPAMKTIGQMRGKILDWQGTKVLCTYHPAYLLRNPEAKKLVWDDMKILLADMGLPIPKRGA